MKEQENTPDGVLYTTSGCHLCERAEALIHNMLGISVRLVDIADNTDLLERYGIRIPVLRRWDGAEELDWPFNTAAIQRLFGVRER